MIELLALTTWQKIGLIMATPGYDSNGEAFLDEGDMTSIAVLLDTYKAERDAELAAAREEADALREQVLRLRDACESVAQKMEASGKLWTPWHSSIAIARLRDALDMTAPQDK